MIIGIDASRANRKYKTGVEWYAWHLIQEMKQTTPADVQVVLYSDSPLQSELAELPDNWKSSVLRWPVKYMWTQTRLSWEMMKNPPDILFIPSHVFPIIHPKKTIMTVHDIAAMYFPESYSLFSRWYTLWSAKHAVKHLWKVIAVSKFTKDELIKAFSPFENNKVNVIHLGYDSEQQRPRDQILVDQLREKYGIKGKYLLSVGRLERKKNTLQTIRAFELLKSDYGQLQLVLAGKPGYGYEEIEQSINNSEYRSDIIMLGWIPEQDLSCMFANAEAFIFPSLYEGFGLPILQAMDSKVPVIASANSAIHEIGKDAVLYVNPKNAEEIALKIRQVFDNSVQREKMVAKGCERVKEFTWSECARKIWELFLS